MVNSWIPDIYDTLIDPGGTARGSCSMSRMSGWIHSYSMLAKTPIEQLRVIVGETGEIVPAVKYLEMYASKYLEERTESSKEKEEENKFTDSTTP